MSNPDDRLAAIQARHARCVGQRFTSEFPAAIRDRGTLLALVRHLQQERDDAVQQIDAMGPEIDRLGDVEALLTAYREKRAVDGLNGREWDATRHYAAEQRIVELETEMGAVRPA